MKNVQSLMPMTATVRAVPCGGGLLFRDLPPQRLQLANHLRPAVHLNAVVQAFKVVCPQVPALRRRVLLTLVHALGVRKPQLRAPSRPALGSKSRSHSSFCLLVLGLGNYVVKRRLWGQHLSWKGGLRSLLSLLLLVHNGNNAGEEKQTLQAASKTTLQQRLFSDPQPSKGKARDTKKDRPKLQK